MHNFKIKTVSGKIMLMLISIFAASPLRASNKDIVIPFDLSTGRPVIDVMINGKGPYRFIFDTGASGSVIDSELSKELNLEVTGKVKVGSPVGTEVKEGEIVEADLNMGGAEFLDIKSASVEIKKFTGADGILSFKVFSGYLMAIDYPALQIRLTGGELTSSNSTPYRLDMLIIIPGSAGGINMDFVIDSGSYGTIALPKDYMDKIKLKYPPEPAGFVNTIGGKTEKFRSQIEGDIIIAGLTYSDPEVYFAENFKHVNIGYEALKDLVITIDQKNSLIHLERTRGDQTLTIAPKEENEYTGIYGERTISMRSGTLYIQRAGGRELQLTAADEADTFGLAAIPNAKLRFTRDGSGKVIELHVLNAEGKWEVSKREK